MTTSGRRLRAALAFLLVPAALAACTSTKSAPGADRSPKPIAPMQLKVMTFNIEYGGTGVDFDSVPAAILASEADVVGVEEAQGNIPRIAEALGWYSDTRLQIVSRYPLVDPPGGSGIYTFVEVRPGRVVAMGNVHLPSGPYGPHQIRKGATAEEVIALENEVRVPAVTPSVDALAGLADAGIPAFLTGDFNTPSFRDWTDGTVGMRPHLKWPLDWPVSETVEGAGFHDSFRDIYPDPVANPGITWPAGRPKIKGSWNPGQNSAADRIDYVYAAGPAETQDSAIVGEEGGPEVGVSVAPWPTDHRGLVSTFLVMPAVAPTLVAVSKRLVTLGDDVEVTFFAPGDDGEKVVIVPAAGDASGAVADQPTGEGSPPNGRLIFSSDGWTPGAYEAVLIGGDGAELARIPLWIQPVGARPEIGTLKPVYDVGEPIQVEWRWAPGNRWDWVGIYKRGADPLVAWYIDWLYTGSTIEGTASFDDGAHGPWPLKPGEYSVYLLRDDDYVRLAGGDFTIRG